MRLRQRVPVTLTALASVLFACDTAVDTTALPDGGSPSCREATMHSDLDWIQANIFTPSCASFSSCHVGAAPAAAGLSLEEGMSETSLVGVESKNVDELGLGPMNLVEPGNCHESYVIVVLRNEPEEFIKPEIGPMPFGNPLLCAEKVDAICRWIESLEPDMSDPSILTRQDSASYNQQGSGSENVAPEKPSVTGKRENR